MKKQNNIKNKSPIGAYIGFLFQTFLKRPFGYLVAILYIVYLSVILLIVPAALNFGPLFIWNIGGFNIAIFNLFFIAASTASIAVAVFRTGRDDGTDLNLSSKPFTKNAIVMVKTLVYLMLTLIINLIVVLLASLVLPIFGVYDVNSNINGITIDQYTGLLLSIFLGNLVNMLFFGGLSVLISIVGGQVITIIGTVGIVFVMNILNFLYPQILSNANDILADKYGTQILSYSCNTLNQYNDPEKSSDQFKFATIQCIANEGIEEYHYDTKEYWDKAKQESGVGISNYIDFAKQLSSLYNEFGLRDARLEEATKLYIGGHSSINYDIDETTHVGAKENIDNGNYPIFYYDMVDSLGKYFPKEIMVGGSMEISGNNWYILSTLFNIPFNSINYASSTFDSIVQPTRAWAKDNFVNTWKPLGSLRLDDDGKQIAANSLDAAIVEYINSPETKDESKFSEIARDAIIEETNKYIEDEDKKFETWTSQQKYDHISKIHTNWTVLIQQKQKEDIEEFVQQSETINDQFPFKSSTITEYFKKQPQVNPNFTKKVKFYHDVYTLGINVVNDNTGQKEPIYSKMVNASMQYAETISNMYVYNATNFYTMGSIVAAWTIISTLLFSASIIVYRKTDFK